MQRNRTILPDGRSDCDRWVSLAGLDCQYLMHQGPSPLLVALHGWLLAGRLWTPLATALAPRWELWAPDLPGFGQRPRPRGLQPNLASYGRWLAAAAQQQANDRPIVLLGHSLGGSVALHAAPLLGEQLVGVIQIAAGGGVYQPRAFAQVRRGGALFLRWQPGGAARQRSGAQPPGRRAPGCPGPAGLQHRSGAVRQLPQLTARLQVPSLWIAGERDQVMASRYVRHLAGYAPQHEFIELAGAGHLPMGQMPEQLAAPIQQWLSQLPSS